MPDHSKILTFIKQCEDAGELRTIIKNARKKGASDIAEAAVRKLVSLVPAEQPGTVEHDFWQMVNAFEYALTEENGKTTRLGRTRQKVARDGVVQTLKDWAFGKSETEGFKMLIARGMAEFTGEAIVLRHPATFEAQVQAAARSRLADAGVDLATLPSAN